MMTARMSAVARPMDSEFRHLASTALKISADAPSSALSQGVVKKEEINQPNCPMPNTQIANHHLQRKAYILWRCADRIVSDTAARRMRLVPNEMRKEAISMHPTPMAVGAPVESTDGVSVRSSPRMSKPLVRGMVLFVLIDSAGSTRR